MVLWLPRLKRCSGCREIKPLEAFNRLTRSWDGRQYNCRACNARWHAEHREHHNSMIARRNARLSEEINRRIWSHLLAHPCADCGETDPIVLEFDHLRDKLYNISSMVRTVLSWAPIRREIEKCEVVCANCHRRRTAQRANNIRWRLAQEMAWGRRDSDPHASV